MNNNSSEGRPNHAEIAERAYQIYEREGCVQGHGQDHWLRAEAELIRERKQRPTEKKQPVQLPTFLQSQAQGMKKEMTKGKDVRAGRSGQV